MSLARAFFTVSGLTMVSRVLGLVREILIAALLGSGPMAQAFFVAFRLPNLFRRFFAEGAFNMAFVPLFSKKLEGEHSELGEAKGSAKRFAEDVLAGLLSVLLVLTLAAQLAMPWFIYVIASGFADDPEKLSLAIIYSQIQFPYLLFMSLVALFSGVLNAMGKFAAAAGAPILLNCAMITGMLAADYVEAEIGLWLSWSVLIAGVLQFLLVARSAAYAGLTLRLGAPRWTPELKRLLALGAPGAVAGGVTQINILIGTTIATFFNGAVVWLTLADRVYQLPLGVIGVAIGVALLPELSRRVRAGQEAEAHLALSRAIELSLALTLPAMVALVAIPTEIVSVLFGRGAFLVSDVEATAAALALFALGLPAYVLIKTLSPAYFADEDTRTPLRFAVISMIVNTGLALALAPALSWYAIPIATAIAAWVNAALLWFGVAAIRLEAGLPRRLIGMMAASAVMGGALYAAARFGAAWSADPLLRYPAAAALVFGGMAIYAMAAIALGGVSLARLRGMLSRRARTKTAG